MASISDRALLRDLIAAPLLTGFAAGKQDQVHADEDGLPQLRPTNILPDGEISFDGAKFIPRGRVGDSDFLTDGEVLFNNTNSTAWVGKSALFRGGDHPAVVCSNHITRIRPNERVSGAFLAEVLNLVQRCGYFGRLATNFNNQAGINADTLADVEIPLGPAERREKLLAALDAARATRRRKLEEADSFLGGLDAFVLDALGLTLPLPDDRTTYAVRVGDLRGGRCDALYHAPNVRALARLLQRSPLPKVPLGDLAPDPSGGATPTRGDQELYSTEGVRFLRIMNIAPFELRLDDVKYITNDVHERMLGRSQLQAGDVVMTITGRVGTAAVVPTDVLPANINQHIVRIRLADRRVSADYLAAYLNCSLGLAMTNRGVTGGTRIAVDYGTVRSLSIPVPKPEIQKKIAAEITRRRDIARRLREEASQLWDDAKRRFEEELLGPPKGRTEP